MKPIHNVKTIVDEIVALERMQESAAGEESRQIAVAIQTLAWVIDCEDFPPPTEFGFGRGVDTQSRVEIW